MGEQEGAALVFVEAALELPAHQRVQFGILVDRAVDAHQEARGLQVGEVFLKIRRRAAGYGVARRSFQHGPTLCDARP